MNKNDLEFLRQWGLDYYISRVYLKDHSYEYYSGLTKPIIKKITEKDLNRFISLLESNPKFFRQKTKQVFSFSEYVPNIDFKKVQSKPLIQFLLTDQFLRIPAKADRLKLFMTCVKLNLYVPFKIFKNIELMFSDKEFVAFLLENKFSMKKFLKYIAWNHTAVCHYVAEEFLNDRINASEFISVVDTYLAQGHIADLSRYINRRDPDDQHYRYNFLEIMVKYNTKESLEVFNYLANNPKFSKDLDICSHTLRFRNFKGDSEAMMKVVHTNLIKKWDEKDQAFYAPKIEMMKKTLFRESIQNL